MAAKKPDAKRQADAAAEALEFEPAIERLETIVEELEGGALTLEESLARYEEGIRLSRLLTRYLDQAEKRIEKLVENRAGEPATEPIDLERSGPDDVPEGQLPF
jgi:exodeoxyribonuclease VII small subunit